MTATARTTLHSTLDGWDLSNYTEPGIQPVAVVVYDTQRDVFLLLSCQENSVARRGGTSDRGEKLSPRELQVLQLVAAGFDNRELASKLKISVNTVKVHLQNIFTRLQVTTRHEAVARAFHDGWIDFSRHVHHEDRHLRASTPAGCAEQKSG
ncbi:MAG: response regulator transcription factor [Chloroflexi bacterium]|nr:response regulator transcription factor [Chloroflexota bacterium]